MTLPQGWIGQDGSQHPLSSDCEKKDDFFLFYSEPVELEIATGTLRGFGASPLCLSVFFCFAFRLAGFLNDGLCAPTNMSAEI